MGENCYRQCISSGYSDRRAEPGKSPSSVFCVYDEPSTDLCLHKNLYLANVHHRAVKRDSVQSIRIE